MLSSNVIDSANNGRDRCDLINLINSMSVLFRVICKIIVVSFFAKSRSSVSLVQLKNEGEMKK